MAWMPEVGRQQSVALGNSGDKTETRNREVILRMAVGLVVMGVSVIDGAMQERVELDAQLCKM